MNFVIIMTDTQNKSMVGAYGNPRVDTPNLDRLAAEGIRFERAYTGTPVCTPARGALFSGLYPQINGAICNNMSPYRHVALMGEVFRYYGYRTAYTGKWHLEGSGYFGNGIPEGGFEPEWWYDGINYADGIGREKFAASRAAVTADQLRQAGIGLETDPYEMTNRIDDPSLAAARDSLHNWILEEMDRVRDPYRTWSWGQRAWRAVRGPVYHGLALRNRPDGFPFQGETIEASR